MDNLERNEALEFHRKAKGKIKIYPTMNIRNEYELAMAYVPGSTPACEEINGDPAKVFDYTGKGNRLAIVCNGTAVLGMGNVGPLASLPVLEGKALLLKLMGDVNAIPVAVDAAGHEEVTTFCKTLAPTVGGINIEDVKSPDAFYIMNELTTTLDIPVFCDDQQGSAVIILSAVWNSLKLKGKTIDQVKIVIIGAGAAGVASAELLLKAGAKNIVVLNKDGILGPAHPHMDPIQTALAPKTNPEGLKGGLDEAASGADILVGLSRGGVISPEHIKKMAEKPVVLALALPEPEIDIEPAMQAGAFIYASGRMKHPNTLLNIHAFPGIVRGAFEVRATKLTDSMLIAAAEALSNMVDRRHLAPDHICPRFFGSETTPRIAEAVGQAAIKDGVALRNVEAGKIYEETWRRLFGDIAHI